MAKNKYTPETDDSGKNSLPLSRLFPNIVTMIGLCVGLFALKYAIMEDWRTSVILIVVAAFVDGIDGRLARMLNASSDFGAQLDSLTDFVNFGVAPAFILYLWTGHEVKGFGWAAALFFIVSAALRLARFNTGLNDDDDDEFEIKAKETFFQGVPAPCGAALGLMPMIVTFLFEESNIQLFSIKPFAVILYMILIAFLMVSRIPTISMKKIRIKKKYSSLFIAGVALFIISLITQPWVTMPIVAILYLCTIPFTIFFYYRLKAKMA